ncbi:HDIG domain-containing metalloprotein [Nanoarchaeota archaeon]
MTIPTDQQIEALWDKYEVPDNIRAHMKAVARVADRLVDWLYTQGHEIDSEVVHAAALLHDLGKMGAKKLEIHHSDLGQILLSNEGIDEDVAEVVGSHADPNLFDLSFEEAIVNYADKRVWEDECVPLETRTRNLAERYGVPDDHVDQLIKIYSTFEQEFGIQDLDLCASPDLEMYMRENNAAMRDDYSSPMGYPASCSTVSRDVARLLAQEGRNPKIIVIRPEHGSEPLAPKKYQGKVEWGIHHVCSDNGDVYDPMLSSEPVPLEQYIRQAFGSDVVITTLVDESEMVDFLSTDQQCFFHQ